MGQRFIEIKGKVVDRESKTILPYASIYIKDKSIGTVSNEAGEFDFKVPSVFAQDTIIISYLGFKNYVSKVSAVAGTTFFLEPTSTKLEEIEILDVSAEAIVRKAIQNIERNYPVSPYIANAFYRDWKRRESLDADSSMVSLMEAAVSIYDKGFSRVNSKKREQVFLTEMRRSLSTGKHLYNYLDFILAHDFVRHTESRNVGNIYSPFDFEHLKDYAIEDVLIQEGTKVYMISATLSSKLGVYKIYIEAERYAFIRIDFKGHSSEKSFLGMESVPSLKRTHHLMAVDNTLVFRKYKNLYFMSYMKLNWTTRTIGDTDGKQTDTRELFQELLINEVITENVSLAKDSLKFPMNYGLSLEKQVRPYNKKFWDEFNIVLDRPVNKDLLKSLEAIGKLDDQFVRQRPDSTSKTKRSRKKNKAK